jgi:hypothetical protein
LDIVMINVWEGVGNVAEASAFCELWGIQGTVLVDEPGAYARRLGIRGVPTNVFVDASGTVTGVGGVAPQDLETEVRRLLGPDAVIDPA